jgi:hypothetical protein
MSSNLTGSKNKRSWLVHVVFVIAALLVVTSPLPASASISQSQSPQPQAPSATCPPGGQCFADVPSTNPFYAFVNRIYQQDLVTGYGCGGPGEPCDAYSRPYYRPVANVTRQQMAKFIDNARHLPGIFIDTTNTTPLYSRTTADAGIGVIGTSIGSSGTGVRGSNTSTGIDSIGVEGASIGGTGVKGTTSSNGGYGVVGENMSGGYGVVGRANAGSSAGVLGTNNAANGWAVYGLAQDSGGVGVRGFATNSTGYGVYGINSNGGQAGHFSGDVQVTGNLSKGGGSFKIDDPLDPANKYLYHSFVESPDMMDVYNGNVTTDAKGEATVQMPNWFDALNRDFRYQLTAIGAPGPNLFIAQKMQGNRFKIAGGSPGLEVSWQVTGIRQDPYANAHRIPVEQDKPANDKGKYLHPTEWGMPEEAGIDYEKQQQMQQPQQPKP